MSKTILLIILGFQFSYMQALDRDKMIVWKSTYVNTTEFTTVKVNDKIEVNGQITGQGLGKLLSVNYQLDINKHWEIQAVKINLVSDSSFNISLRKDENKQWLNENGEILPQLNITIL